MLTLGTHVWKWFQEACWNSATRKLKFRPLGSIRLLTPGLCVYVVWGMGRVLEWSGWRRTEGRGWMEVGWTGETLEKAGRWVWVHYIQRLRHAFRRRVWLFHFSYCISLSAYFLLSFFFFKFNFMGVSLNYSVVLVSGVLTCKVNQSYI